MNQTDCVDSGEVAPRESFDRVPDLYHVIRPGYPPALFDDLFALLPTRPHILEVGPGTGQATRNLLSRGATVDAIEIGPRMAAKLRKGSPSCTTAIPSSASDTNQRADRQLWREGRS